MFLCTDRAAHGARKAVLAVFLAVSLAVQPLALAATAASAQAQNTTLTSIPSASEIIAQLKANNPSQSHPRLMATAADFSRIRNNVASDSYARQWYQNLKQTVAVELADPLPTYTTDSTGSILIVSRDVLAKIQNIGMLYQLDPGNAATYLNGAYKILTAAGNFKDWGPNHFLDVAEMTAAFAIGYDWLYNGWTDDQRAFLRSAIVSKGLDPALAVYRGQVTGTFDAAGWVSAENNWTTVCSGGLAMGALAVGDESSELSSKAGEILNDGLTHIQQVLPLFQPDGGGYEGPEYWEYNARYFVYYASSMKSALGTDYGLSDIAGVDKTAYYPIYMNGPEGCFNYGDNSSTLVSSPILFWFANRFGNPDLSWYERSLIGSGGGAQDLLWYDPGNVSDANSVRLDLDKYFGGIDVGTMRSAWNDSDATYVGFKGGDNTFNHSDADLGTFVLDALGERWADDLGRDDYSLPSYFDLSGFGKTNYYRLRTEGQNTLVLNPGATAGQNLNAHASITGRGSTAEQAYMVADLSAAYADQASSVKRGIALINGRKDVLVQDEIQMKSPGEFDWFMYTQADIQITDDGRSAVLSMGGKKLWAHILSDNDSLSFDMMDAVPLPTSPNPSGQTANVEKKLVVRGTGITSVRFAVLFVPLQDGEATPTALPELTPLNQWSVSSASAPQLKSISVGGTALEGFRGDVLTYHVPLSKNQLDTMPAVNAQAETGNGTLRITQADTATHTATITVGDGGSPENTATYRAVFVVPTGANVSDSSNNGNLPINTLDNNFSTIWASEGDGQWIQYHLDSRRTLSSIDIAFSKGDQRSETFDILTSTDGSSWTTVYTGKSSGKTAGYETFAFTQPSTCNDVRIVGHGNDSTNPGSNVWNSIAEVKIDGVPKEKRPDMLGSLSASIYSTSLSVGASEQLSVTGQMQSGADIPWSTAQTGYYSSNPSVATVDASGKITGVATGSATVGMAVTLSHYTKYASVNLSVTDGIVTLKASDATYVQDGSYADKVVYTGGSQLALKGDPTPGYARQAYLYFDLSAIKGKVLSATLHLHAGLGGGTTVPATLGILSATGSWSSKTMTWNTQPTMGSLLDSQSVTSATLGWYTFNLTDYVGTQAGSAANLALLQNYKNVDGTGRAISVDVPAGDYRPYLEVKTGTPVAAFDAPASVPVGTQPVFTDQSAQMSGSDTLTGETWSYSTDGGTTWSAETETAPSGVFDLSQADASASSLTYKVRLRVTDGVSTAQCIHDVTVYDVGTPSAAFTVPSEARAGDSLTFSDVSTAATKAGKSWDSIAAEEWSYSSDGGTTWSIPSAQPPASFSAAGTYLVRLRVRNAGNPYAPGTWSDDTMQTLEIAAGAAPDTGDIGDTGGAGSTGGTGNADTAGDTGNPRTDTGNSATSVSISAAADSDGTYVARIAPGDVAGLDANVPVEIRAGAVTLTIPAFIFQSNAAQGTLRLIVSDSSADTLQTAASLAGQNRTVLQGFDLRLVGEQSGTLIHDLGGTVHVVLHLSDDLLARAGDSPDLRLYNLDTVSNRLADMSATVDTAGKTISFDTTHFSTFVIAQTLAAANPQTGVRAAGVPAKAAEAAMVTAALILPLLCLHRKRRNGGVLG